MRVLKKMSFDALVENISKEDKKNILGGSGSNYGVTNGSYYDAKSYFSNGSSSAIGIALSPVKSFYTGLSSTNIPGTALYVPQQSYNNPNGWGSVATSMALYNYNNSYENYNKNNTTAGSNNNVGWETSANGNMKTNNPEAISRLMGFVNSNIANNLDTGNGLDRFLENEKTAQGRAINDTIFGGWLKEVKVINNYHGPSTIPKGLVYVDGKLQFQSDLGVMKGSNGVMMGSGSTTTYATITSTFGIPVHGSAVKPTALEAALMSKAVYGDKGVQLEGNWAVSKAATGLKYDDPSSGFKSQLYERTVNGKKEYCYVTAGTDPTSLKDWATNALQVAGVAKQYEQSVANAKALKNLFGDSLSFAGHSLGGGLAEANARATGESATTFNAAGLSPITALSLGLGFLSDTKAYIMVTDPLNLLQQSTPLLNTAGGSKQLLNCASYSAVANGHSIDSVIEALRKN